MNTCITLQVILHVYLKELADPPPLLEQDFLKDISLVKFLTIQYKILGPILYVKVAIFQEMKWQK